MSLLRELRLLAPGLRPSATGDAYLRATAELILACQDGLFVSGILSDPHRLAEALIIERDDVARFINIEDLAVTQAPASGAATAGEKFVLCT